MITFNKPMIEEGTLLYDYPLILLKYMEKYKNVPLNFKLYKEIWDSLSDEEKATNKEYTIEYNKWFGCEIIKRNGVIIDKVSFLMNKDDYMTNNEAIEILLSYMPKDNAYNVEDRKAFNMAIEALRNQNDIQNEL